MNQMHPYTFQEIERSIENYQAELDRSKAFWKDLSEALAKDKSKKPGFSKSTLEKVKKIQEKYTIKSYL